MNVKSIVDNDNLAMLLVSIVSSFISKETIQKMVFQVTIEILDNLVRRTKKKKDFLERMDHQHIVSETHQFR